MKWGVNMRAHMGSYDELFTCPPMPLAPLPCLIWQSIEKGHVFFCPEVLDMEMGYVVPLAFPEYGGSRMIGVVDDGALHNLQGQIDDFWHSFLLYWEPQQ
jgi:hypothetical protein